MFTFAIHSSSATVWAQLLRKVKQTRYILVLYLLQPTHQQKDIKR